MRKAESTWNSSGLNRLSTGSTQPVRAVDNTSNAKRLEWERSLTATARAKLPPTVNGILDVPEHQRDAQQLQTIRAAYRFGDQARNLVGGIGQPLLFMEAAHLQTALFRLSVDKQIAELKKSEPTVVTTLVMEERKMPRSTHIHLGGDFLRKGARVSPEVPSVLPPLPEVGAHRIGIPNRLEMGRWLVDPRNPLTPRVTMNRFWERYFGSALVETENDFGMQGSPPTHPELLDWLAAEFVSPSPALSKGGPGGGARHGDASSAAQPGATTNSELNALSSD